MNDKPKSRWYQFSLRTLFAVFTVLAVALGVGLLCVAPAERQRKAVQSIRGLGGYVEYRELPGNESWPKRQLRRWLPRDYFDEVVVVMYTSVPASNEDLRDLQGLPQLQRLSLVGTELTDNGLVHVVGLGKLKALVLTGTHVTDDGLRQLQSLERLEVLSLASTQVTDAGLIHLRGFTQLKRLDLFDTKVTDAGVAELQKTLPGCDIER